jgi:general stress protein YciG
LTQQNIQLKLKTEREAWVIPCFYFNQREVRQMAEHRGGSNNFSEDREKASEAGRKGGQHSGGNFKNDPERASEAGKKGGQSSGKKSDNSK